MALCSHSSTWCVYRISFLLAAALVSPCHGSSNTLSDKGGFLNSKAFREDIMNAIRSSLGCGLPVAESHVKATTVILNPMWDTIPKSNGNIDRRSLRYLAHRYFMQTSNLMVRGFEPNRVSNDSQWGNVEILSQMVPAYVESILEAKHNSVHDGFTKDDAVDMVLTLSRLITDSHMTLLESVYGSHKKSIGESVSQKDLLTLLEEYMLKWMVDAEPEDYAMLLGNRTLANEVLPHYTSIINYVEGRAKMLEYSRSKLLPKGRGRDIWAKTYSFDDAHAIVGGITQTFQAYWQSECDSMKGALVSMDTHGTGRVPLSKFYDKAINTDWRFGESEVYLREMGALDDSSSTQGPQVLIPNYIQATSNCIISTAHYLVCCSNECEALLGEIESSLRSPTASPEDIINLVRNMTSQTILDSDESADVDEHMILQLQEVAKNSGGAVPLHGRLFAQWLHYIFPRECPYPHKAGLVSTMTPSEYGEDYIANHDVMQKHASNVTEIHVNKEELEWMSQWSPEEELLLDYQDELGGGHWQHLMLFLGGIAIVAVGFQKGLPDWNSKKISTRTIGSIPNAHWV